MILVDLVQASVRPYWIAWIVQAFVNVNLALDAQESRPALALETFQGVAAGAAMLARLTPAIVDAVLALFARKAQGAKAAEVSLNVLALAAIEARIGRAFVHLDSAVGARPAGLAEAQSAEEDVDAGAVFPAGRKRPAKVHFGLAPLPSESGRTGAGEIVNQVGAVAAQQTGRFGAVVDVVGAERTFPSGRADAFETALFQRDALGGVGARIGGAGVQGATAIGSSVARPAQAGELAMSGLVLAHGPVVAGRPVAAGLFLLALEAGIAGRTGAGVALLLVATCSAIVARLGGAVVDVDFAETASESGRTVAEGRVGL